MPSFEIPHLRTFRQLPSWCNLRGHLDRSACIEVRVSEIRRLSGCVHIDPLRRDRRGRPVHTVAPLPDERNAARRFADGSQRLTTGTFTLSAHQLNHLHGWRNPRMYAGDFRTNRANVMRHDDRRIHHRGHREHRDSTELVSSDSNAGFSRVEPHNPFSVPSVSSVVPTDSKNKHQFKTRITRANPYAFPPDHGLDANPNKGASRTKKIGLRFDWTQTLRIEKWTYPRRKLPVYFLVCPGHDRSIHHRGHRGHRERTELGSHNSPGGFSRHNPNLSSVSSVSSVVNSVPPVSTRKPGRENPTSRRCPQRCLKLLMVQCTEQENLDAQAAQLWIESIPPSMVPKLRDKINQLRDRYGPIFEPRTLLCPRCLGVKYGNNPETVRQGWRRRNGKADTSVAQRRDKGTKGRRDRVKEDAASASYPPIPLSRGPSVPTLLTIPIELTHYTREDYYRGREFIEGVPPSDEHYWARNPEAWREKKKERQKSRRREYARMYYRRKKSSPLSTQNSALSTSLSVAQARKIIEAAGYGGLYPATNQLTPEDKSEMVELAGRLRARSPG